MIDPRSAFEKLPGYLDDPTHVFLYPHEATHRPNGTGRTLREYRESAGYTVVVLGPIPLEGSTLGAPQVRKGDTK